MPQVLEMWSQVLIIWIIPQVRCQDVKQTKLSKLMMNYSSRQELDVSWFKFIFEGHCILEDITFTQPEMENVVFNQRFTLELLNHFYSIKGLLQRLFQGVNPRGYSSLRRVPPLDYFSIQRVFSDFCHIVTGVNIKKRKLNKITLACGRRDWFGRM